MKKIYICGDSFGSVDPEYPGFSWTERLTELLHNRATVINLAQVCASNLLINLQVNRAIVDQADYVICLATAATRDEVSICHTVDAELLDRFHPFVEESQRDLVSYSIPTAHNAPVTADQLQLIKKYHAEFFDLDLAIYKNCCIIENTLQKLTDSGIPFLFDQGGFENPQFANVSTGKYFRKYQDHFSEINLWNYTTTRELRPYFHIVDPAVHQHIADYYYRQIKHYV
jgi:hypothetical protein